MAIGDIYLKKLLGLRDELQESILDPPHKERADWLFNEDGKIKKEIKSQIYSILRKWREQINFKFDIDAIKLKGSSIGFQYTAESDIDVTVLTSMTKEQVAEVKDISPSGAKLEIDGEESLHKIDFYFLPKGEDLEEKNMDNIYDLGNDKWVKKTDSYSMELPYSYGIHVASFFLNGIDLAISQFFRDKREFEVYQALDSEKQDITEDEKKEAMNRKILDLKADVDQLNMISHLISAFRKEAYKDEPFEISISLKKENEGNPHQSLNEIVAKILERFGYRDKLKQLAEEGKKFIEHNEIK
jgi:predicted nucleotidyltransferase